MRGSCRLSTGAYGGADRDDDDDEDDEEDDDEPFLWPLASLPPPMR